MKFGAWSVTGVFAGTAIGIPSFLAIVKWLGTPALLPSSALEQMVFGLILLRAALYFSLPRFRRIQAGTIVVLLFGDILVIPGSVALYYLTGYAGFADFGGTYLSAWLSAALLLYTPVAALAVADSMRLRSKLVAVVPAAAGAYLLSALVLEGLGGAIGSQGTASVARLTIGDLRSGAPLEPGPSALLLACGAVLFVALTAYSVTVAPQGSKRLVPQLTLGLMGVAAIFGWVQLTLDLPSWEAFGLPTISLVGLAWVLTRES